MANNEVLAQAYNDLFTHHQFVEISFDAGPPEDARRTLTEYNQYLSIQTGTKYYFEGQVRHYSVQDGERLVYNAAYLSIDNEDERIQFLEAVRMIDANVHARVTRMRRAIQNADIAAVGQLIFGGDLPVVVPQPRVNAMPVLWVTDIHRAGQLAYATQGILQNFQGNSEIVGGWFLSFGQLVNPEFMQVLHRTKPDSFIYVNEREFLQYLNAPPPQAGISSLDSNYFWAFQLIVLGVVGKAADAESITKTFVNRVRTFFSILNVPNSPVMNFVVAVYNLLKNCFLGHNLELVIASYVCRRAADEELARTNRWLYTLFNQALLLLLFAGLQGLKLAHDFYVSDSSAVSTIGAVAEQAEAVEKELGMILLPLEPIIRMQDFLVLIINYGIQPIFLIWSIAPEKQV